RYSRLAVLPEVLMPKLRVLSRAATVVLCGFVACKKAGPPPPPPPPNVQVAPAIAKDIAVYQEWIGTLDGNVNAEIRPQIEGYVLDREYAEGSLVKAGETLFKIDPREFQATYDQAKGNVSQFEAMLANAKTTVKRYTPLAAERAISQQELDD